MWPCRVASGRPLPVSHSRTVPSSPPLATSWPSAESATPQTAPVWPCKVASGRPLAASHSRTVPSSPPLATSRPSALRAPRPRPRRCAPAGSPAAARSRSPTAAPSRPHRRWPPAGRRRRAPRPRPRRCGPAGWPAAARCSVSHSRTVPSSPPLATSRPSARERHAPDPAGVPLQGRQRLPGAGLPQPHRPVPAAAGQQPAVGGERHAPDRAGVALHRPQRRAVRHPPQPHLPGRRPRRQQRAVPAQRDRAGEIERFGQHGLGEVGVHQAGVLGIHLRQVGLPNRQAREVQPAQVAPQQPQQVDHVARPIALLRRAAAAPAVQQRQQPLLGLRLRRCCAFSRCRSGCADQPLLALAHVVLRLRLDQRLARPAAPARPRTISSRQPLHQPLGHVLQHHRLQRERGALLAPAPAASAAAAPPAPPAPRPRGTAGAQIGHQGAEVHRLALDGQPVSTARSAAESRASCASSSRRMPPNTAVALRPGRRRSPRRRPRGSSRRRPAGPARCPRSGRPAPPRLPRPRPGPVSASSARPVGPSSPPSRSARTGPCALARGPSSGGSSRLVSSRQLGWPPRPATRSTCP